VKGIKLTRGRCGRECFVIHLLFDSRQCVINTIVLSEPCPAFFCSFFRSLFPAPTGRAIRGADDNKDEGYDLAQLPSAEATSRLLALPCVSASADDSSKVPRSRFTFMLESSDKQAGKPRLVRLFCFDRTRRLAFFRRNIALSSRRHCLRDPASTLAYATPRAIGSSINGASLEKTLLRIRNISIRFNQKREIKGEAEKIKRGSKKREVYVLAIRVRTRDPILSSASRRGRREGGRAAVA